jgi:hypothetical protein
LLSDVGAMIVAMATDDIDGAVLWGVTALADFGTLILDIVDLNGAKPPSWVFQVASVIENAIGVFKIVNLIFG